MHDWKTSRTGLIPAHAGKTASSPPLAWRPAAHPRSRGENVVRENLCRNPSGSSPLTRGKPVRVGHAYWWSGLIPAHAGKTSSLTDRQTPRPAHPRSRGENRAAAEQAVRAVGSSPLTRGKHGNTMPLGALIGLIPAHAGKTLRQRRPRPRQRAHPRSRGENRWRACTQSGASGSSPLTRGKRFVDDVFDAQDRLIPAHAGKTASPQAHAQTHEAHPRSRGENEALRASSDALMGSSPLTRGKHRRVGDPHQPLGLIPAHAGKTPGRPRRPTLGAAHPRSRGENARANDPACPRRGSSPLTRGKLGGDKLVGVLSRLIPAHAGKTSCPPR